MMVNLINISEGLTPSLKQHMSGLMALEGLYECTVPRANVNLNPSLSVGKAEPFFSIAQ